MKWNWTTVLGLVLLAGIVFAQDKSAKKEKQPAAKTDAKAKAAEEKAVVDKVSYSYGFNEAKRLISGGYELNSDQIAKGFQDAFAGKKSQFTDKESREAFAAFDKIRAARKAEKTKAAKKVGEDFLAANKKKKGVITLKSGLQYLVLKEGTGKKPKATDRVKAHYHGTLIDGTVFDSSVERKRPFTTPVNRVIPAWIEALQLMKVGSKWRLFSPSDLAYGERGSPPKIAPHSVLIFEIELLEILPPGGN